MANQVKITELPSTETVQDSDYLVVDNGIVTSKVTKSDLLLGYITADDIEEEVPPISDYATLEDLNGRALTDLSNINLNGENKIKSLAGIKDVQLNGTSVVLNGIANFSATPSADTVAREQIGQLSESITDIFSMADIVISDEDSFNAEIFDNGALLTEGGISQIVAYPSRIVSYKVMCFDYPITITPNNGYRILVYGTDGTMKRTFDSGWQTTPYTVEARQAFLFNVSRVNEDKTETLDVVRTLLNIKITPSRNTILKNRTVVAYVDGTKGNDNNLGTAKSPFKTISKAVSEGFENISVKPNTYNEQVTINGMGYKSIHLYADNATWGSNVNKPKVIIDGGSTISNPLKISNMVNVVLEDVVVTNSASGSKGCIIEYCQNLEMQNCEFLNNGHDGCVINYTNGIIRDCKADYNGNDGFNMNYYGDTQFINCSGHDNVDDGISHHQGTTGLIDGGEWYNNGKGGVASPVHGSQVDLKNLYCHNNGYGVYANCDSDAEARTFHMWNCVLVDNHVTEHAGTSSGYGLTCKRNTCIMYNCKIANNDHQTTAPSGGQIITL